MPVKDPSIAGTIGESDIASLTQQYAVEKKLDTNGNGHHASEKIEIGQDGKLAKAPEPTLTAPPDHIVYPPENIDAIQASPDASAIAIKPILIRRTVSGSYSGIAGSFRLDLRADVDRPGTLNTASFDFFTLGIITSYWGSFALTAPSVSYTTTKVTIEGGLAGTKAVWANKVRIEINRNLIWSPAAPATVKFFQNATPGAIYTCNFASAYFRTVLLETDYENGTVLGGDYDTGSLASPLPHRVLNIVKAYAEAGVNMVMTGGNDVVANSESGADARWTETEMHASMIHHFSKYSSQPQWAAWLFAARRAVSTGLLGIMFDYLPSLKPQRQGCAIFQDTIKDYYSGLDYNRHILYAYTHEMGHCFNLLHSWDKGRPNSLSWMNYDWKYDQLNGAGSFWNNFNFVFDSGELMHIRHGFRNNVIMGGSDFASGSGLEHQDALSDFDSDMIENNSGLKLELQPVKKSYALGEPVVVEVRLRCMDMNGKVVNSVIHPKYDYVRIAILKPNGKIALYEPFAHNCMLPKETALDKDNNTVYTSAYIGYGKDGFYFDQPGFYKIKAAYQVHDGSILQSDEMSIRVKSPVTTAEDEIADLYFTSDAGKIFYLLGSDAETLKQGMDDMQTVHEKYKTNPLSIYAEMVLGVNEAMRFKTIDTEVRKVLVRKRNLTSAKPKLHKVINASKGSEGVDNITLNWLFRHLAKSYLLEGDDKTAKSTLKEMEETFKAKKLRPVIQQTIAKQAAAVLKLA